MSKIIYEKDYGEESYGEVRLIEGEYRCFVTPQYGGDWIEEGRFTTEEDAIKFMDSIC